MKTQTFKKKSTSPSDYEQFGFAEVRIDAITKNRSLFSKMKFKSGDVISEFFWTVIHSTPSYLTVQVSDTEHIELLPECLECVNHSCDPNAFFDTTKKQFVCLKPIQEGEEITFFYPSAEWNMDQSFQCQCKSENCIGLIRGAKYLSADQVKSYRFTDFIRQKLLSV